MQNHLDWMINMGANVVGIGGDGHKFNVHNGMRGRLGPFHPTPP